MPCSLEKKKYGIQIGVNGITLIFLLATVGNSVRSFVLIAMDLAAADEVVSHALGAAFAKVFVIYIHIVIILDISGLCWTCRESHK